MDNKLFHTFLYRSPDDGAASGSPGEEVLPEESPEPAAEEPSSEEKIVAAVGKTIDEKLAAARAEAAQAQRFSQAQAMSRRDPSSEALNTLDLRDELMDEVDEILRDAPAEIRAEAKKDLRQFRTLAQLAAARDAGIHRKIAYAALGQAVSDRRFSPGGSVSAPSREPVHSERSAPAATWYAREQQELNALFGGILTADDMRRGQELDRARGARV